jgi:hypothetical protein
VVVFAVNVVVEFVVPVHCVALVAVLVPVDVALPQGPQAVQTGSNIVNGEELLNLAPFHVNPDPLLMPLSNELDIFVKKASVHESMFSMCLALTTLFIC